MRDDTANDPTIYVGESRILRAAFAIIELRTAGARITRIKSPRYRWLSNDHHKSIVLSMSNNDLRLPNGS